MTRSAVHSEDSNPPIPAGPEIRFTMTAKTIIGIIVAVGLGAFAYANLKSDVAAHSVQLQGISATVAQEHDLLLELRSEQKMQARTLNYLAGGRRGEPPVIANNPGSP